MEDCNVLLKRIYIIQSYLFDSIDIAGPNKKGKLANKWQDKVIKKNHSVHKVKKMFRASQYLIVIDNIIL